MYWAHLIFSLVFGIFSPSLSAATKPGYLDFDNLPETNFSCDGKVIGGYYADVETGCQMFHVCTIGQKAEVTDIKFLCLNGTVFDQETRVCERIDEVDCSKSESFFGLNLELYGNNANVGIQPENEFECEDCSTEEDYDSEETTNLSTTTLSTTTSTTRTSTTTPRPTTTTTLRTTTTTQPKLVQFPSSSPETIAALLALHNAFTQSLQQNNQPKVQAPPPRVINNAFAQTNKPSTSKPFYIPTSPTININLKTQYSPEENGYGNLNSAQQRIKQNQNRFYQLTTPSPTSNYHHFQNSDTSFGHSFDHSKPYNFQFFHSRRIEEPVQKASVSIVTSTSTSTSVKTSKPNITSATLDFPTGYDEYQDEIDDPFFDDVPKLRSKRSDDFSHRHPNHKYPENEKSQLIKRFNESEIKHQSNIEPEARHPNHRYEETTTEKPSLDEPNRREEFLQNLLGSIDMDEHDRQKMVNFFIKEEKQMDENQGFLHQLGNRLGEMVMEDVNKTIFSTKQEKNNSNVQNLDRLSQLWKEHYEEMSKEVNLNFEVSQRHKRDVDNWNKFDENATDIEYIDTDSLDSITTQKSSSNKLVKRQIKQIDTEKFTTEYEPRRRQRGRQQSSRVTDRTSVRTTPRTSSRASSRSTSSTTKDSERSTSFNIRPVSEEVDEGEFTTRPYKRVVQRARQLPRGRQLPRTPEKVHVESEVTPVLNYKTTQSVAKDSETTIRSPPARHSVATIPPSNVVNVTRNPKLDTLKDWTVPVYEVLNESPSHQQRSDSRVVEMTQPTSIAQTQVPKQTTPINRSRGRVRGSLKEWIEPITSTTTISALEPGLEPDPNFSCEGKVKGGFYADINSDCRGFFICSQGQINGPLLKSHFWCGATTKFNQRSRTCQADYLVSCSVSKRYFHLNNDFLVPEHEDSLKGTFEPMKVEGA